MDENTRWIIGAVIVPLVLALNAWLWRRITKMEESHSAHKDHVAGNYKPKEDVVREIARLDGRVDAVQAEVKNGMQRFEDKLDASQQRIEHQLGRIYDQLNAKADK